MSLSQYLGRWADALEQGAGQQQQQTGVAAQEQLPEPTQLPEAPEAAPMPTRDDADAAELESPYSVRGRLDAATAAIKHYSKS